MHRILFDSPAESFPRFPSLRRSLAPTNSSVAFWSAPSEHDSGSGLGSEPVPVIYAVDDMPCLTELYGLVLSKAGFLVRSFYDRKAAVASLCAATRKPVLLITDLHNPSMRMEPFLEQCVGACPELRILLASGFGYHQAWCFSVKPDRFLPKPFTPDELRHTVEAMVASN
jgi:DNA-binding NtrC family response regulator